MTLIRPYREADRDAVISVWQEAGLVRSWNDPELDIDRKLGIDPDGLLVAVQNDQVVGVVMAGYEGHRGWIQYLGVRPEFQKAGVGRALVEAAVELLRQRGCPKINLQVRRGNSEVIAFYERMGFVEDDVLSLGLRLIDDEGRRS